MLRIARQQSSRLTKTPVPVLRHASLGVRQASGKLQCAISSRAKIIMANDGT